MPTSRKRYGSLPWIALVERTLHSLCEGHIPDGVNFVFNEILTGVPKELQPGCGERVGWYIKLANAELDVGAGILQCADLRVTMDYRTVQPYVSVVFAKNPQVEREARMAMINAYREGKYLIEGDQEAMAGMPWAGKLHDALAPCTC
ncbi:hypothetical protein [Pseudohaliea sp.]|uniref:hypothetical protein n=1 Tax=Pseudohaliea sp. TaxID=2740289 RepID=UPI0032EC5AD3